ncbi:hypothetical protein [Sphingomonas sp.]|uniref:hypothetical protein n=1 Tax=Sphingomonas sp. TaxID=28214 RepID=UPI00257EDFD0|nr:hypothetical protein [Sphingomonas sp.]
MMKHIIAALMPLANSKVAATIAPAIISTIFGAITALAVFWFKSREPLNGAIVWQWQYYPNGQESEEPFVAVQNRAATPAFIKRARLLKGNFIKREASRYAFSYPEMTDGSFPLEIAAQGVSTFPLSQSSADKILEQAYWFNKLISYVLKRPFLWVELKTISGRRIVIPANDAADFQDRPLWIDLHWFPPPRPLWASAPKEN